MSYTRLLRRTAPLAALSLALWSGCILYAPGTEPGEEEVGTCDPAGLDLDDDCVSDTLDNCPNLENAEQLDADRDGRGDACDLVMVARTPTRIASPVAGAPLARTLTTIENNTDEPRLWKIEPVGAELAEGEVELPEDAVFFKAHSGEILPGEAMTLEVMIDPDGLAAGTYRAAFAIENDLYDTWPVEVELELIDVADSQCLFDVRLVSARLEEAQRGEETLEMALEASADGPAATWGPRSFVRGTAYDLDLAVTYVLVEHGEVSTVPVSIETEERDAVSAYGADDDGSGVVDLQLRCDKPNVSHTMTIIDSAGAELVVTLEASAD